MNRTVLMAFGIGLCNKFWSTLLQNYFCYIGTVKGHIVDAPPSTTKFDPVM